MLVMWHIHIALGIQIFHLLLTYIGRPDMMWKRSQHQFALIVNATNRQKVKIMIDKISKDTVYLLNLLSEIRAAAGDPEGNLMQDELVEHIEKLKNNSDKLEKIKEICKH